MSNDSSILEASSYWPVVAIDIQDKTLFILKR